MAVALYVAAQIAAFFSSWSLTINKSGGTIRTGSSIALPAGYLSYKALHVCSYQRTHVHISKVYLRHLILTRPILGGRHLV